MQDVSLRISGVGISERTCLRDFLATDEHPTADFLAIRWIRNILNPKP